jgi:hypothetical protein
MAKLLPLLILFLLIFFELFPTVVEASGFVPCPVPVLKNGRAKIQMRGRMVKFKCFRPYTLIGK